MNNAAYIYGAGYYGDKCFNMVREHYPQIEIEGIVDSYKSGKINGYSIKTIQDIRNTDANVIVAISSFEIAKNVVFDLKENGVCNVWWYYGEWSGPYKDFFIEQTVNCAEWDGTVLKQAEMHLYDACNLNCRGCTHFSPLFKKNTPSKNRIVDDVKLLSELFDHVATLYLLGGEPLLNNEIGNCVLDIRKILPAAELVIITNGLLIPSLSDKTWDVFRENYVKIIVSEYLPTIKIRDRIIEILSRQKVIYKYRDKVSDGTFNLPLTVSKNSKREKRCLSEGCTIIHDKRIARCPTLMYIDAFNEKYGQNLPNDGIIDMSTCPKNEELIEKLKERVPLCDYCVDNSIIWERCCGNISDFAEMD